MLLFFILHTRETTKLECWLIVRFHCVPCVLTQMEEKKERRMNWQTDGTFLKNLCWRICYMLNVTADADKDKLISAVVVCSVLMRSQLTLQIDNCRLNLPKLVFIDLQHLTLNTSKGHRHFNSYTSLGLRGKGKTHMIEISMINHRNQKYGVFSMAIVHNDQPAQWDAMRPNAPHMYSCEEVHVNLARMH